MNIKDILNKGKTALNHIETEIADKFQKAVDKAKKESTVTVGVDIAPFTIETFDDPNTPILEAILVELKEINRKLR